MAVAEMVGLRASRSCFTCFCQGASVKKTISLVLSCLVSRGLEVDFLSHHFFKMSKLLLKSDLCLAEWETAVCRTSRGLVIGIDDGPSPRCGKMETKVQGE